MRSSASSTGRNAIPEPECSTHWPRPKTSGYAAAVSSRKSSTAVVFPIPASPDTKTMRRRPPSADSNAVRSTWRASSRPTTAARRASRSATERVAMVAMNRYPPSSLAMKRGVRGSSPRMARRSLM